LREEIVDIAKRVIEIERAEIEALLSKIGESFTEAVENILESDGKVVVIGMGKSGIIGKKISATLSSTGTPSIFLHPAEAYHGDLGVVESRDIAILISNSGETDEVIKVLPYLKENGNRTISMSGNSLSTLAKNCHLHLDISVSKEACPLQLAPTSSTTATLVMGDALAVALMEKRGFREENFARFHPGGSLGKRLLTKVVDIMKKDDLPVCSRDSSIKEVIHTISKNRFGLVVVLEDSEVWGVITDGDIRRAMEREEESRFFSLRAEDIATKDPKTISKERKLTDAEEVMVDMKINSLLVVENRKLSGIIQIYDLE
jgi:arabinose-5-phosphate isomerase